MNSWKPSELPSSDRRNLSIRETGIFLQETKGETDEERVPLVNQALELFGNYCYQALVSCNEISGGGLLNSLNQASIPAAVVSGAVQHELRRVFDARDLTSRFEHVSEVPKRN